MRFFFVIITIVIFLHNPVYANDAFICKVISKESCGEERCGGRKNPKKDIRVINLTTNQYIRNEEAFEISEIITTGVYKVIRINQSFMKILTMDLPIGDKKELWNKKGFFSEVADKYDSFALSWGMCELN